MTQSCQVTIPGKIMLAGEYSVLDGGRALACAVNTYMHITLEPSAEPGIHIQSDMWDKTTISLLAGHSPNQLPENIRPAFLTVRRALELLPMADADWKLTIQSEFPATYGLGSSSAIYLGILKAFCHYYDVDDNPLIEARKLQTSSQGVCSGYDVWTQANGGMVVFQADATKPVLYEQHDYFRVFVGGKGAVSRILVPQTLQWLRDHRKLDEMKENNERLINLAVSLFCQHDEDIEQEFFDAVKEVQRVVQASPARNDMIDRLGDVPEFGETWIAKTTGAGGEDAILLFGRAEFREAPEEFLKANGWYPLTVAVAPQGATAS